MGVIMARKTTKDDFEEIATPQEEIDFETFLEEIGPGTASIDVFRCMRSGERERIDRVELDALLNDPHGFLYDSYGAGKYMLHFKGADRRYRGSKTLSVGDRKTNGNST